MFVSATVCAPLGETVQRIERLDRAAARRRRDDESSCTPIRKQSRRRQFRGRPPPLWRASVLRRPRPRTPTSPCRAAPPARCPAEPPPPTDCRSPPASRRAVAAPRACGAGRRRNRRASRGSSLRREERAAPRRERTSIAGDALPRRRSRAAPAACETRAARPGRTGPRDRARRVGRRRRRGTPFAPARRPRPASRGRASVYFAATIAACASDCVIPATSSAAGIGSIRSCAWQHRVAVEVGHHEASAAAQHLTHVQVAVSLDDRASLPACRDRRGSPRSRRGAGARTAALGESGSAQTISSVSQGRVAPPRGVRVRRDGRRAGQRGVQLGDHGADRRLAASSDPIGVAGRAPRR